MFQKLRIFCIILSPGGGTVGDVLEERLNGLALIDACRSARQHGGAQGMVTLGQLELFIPNPTGINPT